MLAPRLPGGPGNFCDYEGPLIFPDSARSAKTRSGFDAAGADLANQLVRATTSAISRES
jgi:hypothetical protein